MKQALTFSQPATMPSVSSSVDWAPPQVTFMTAVSSPPSEQPLQKSASAVVDTDASSANAGPIDAHALASAVERNDVDAVKALIKAGVDLRPLCWYDTPVLVTAAAKGCFEIVQLLVAARANVNTGYDRLPLHSAAENGHLNIVRYLLTAGAYAESEDARGYDVLTAAAAGGQLSVVRFLVTHGVITTPNVALRAMTLATQNGHASVYAFLQSIFSPGATVAPLSVAPLSVVQSSEPQPKSVIDELIDRSVAELKDALFQEDCQEA